jgi:arylsulfatase A-like enzyme
VDRSLGRFLERLRGHPRWKSTIVVVTSDHGEELFDHGGWDHGFSLHDHQIRVPLIFRLPEGSQAGQVVDDDVRLLDLMPTLLAVAKADLPPDVIGRDLLAPPPDVPPPVFASCNKDRPGESAVVFGGLKLIADREAGTRQVFDLGSDPLELDDLSDGDGQDTEALESALQRLLEERDASAVTSRPLVELTDEQIERLRELGYVH